MYCYKSFSFLIAAFIELVHSSNGTTQRGTDYGGLQDNKLKRRKSSTKDEKRNLLAVPSHFVHTDISGIKEDTLIFSNMMFCILLQFFLIYIIFIFLLSEKKLFSFQTVICIRFPVFIQCASDWVLELELVDHLSSPNLIPFFSRSAVHSTRKKERKKESISLHENQKLKSFIYFEKQKTAF